jgi:ureidoacrylate peracid hydrolase
MHKIEIPQDVIAQIEEARGGKINKYDTFIGPKTALVVVDLQNFFVLPEMRQEIPIAREIVPHVNRLAEAIRAAGGKVFWLQFTLMEEINQSWNVFFDGLAEPDVFTQLAPGTPGHQLYEGLDTRQEDFIIEKSRYSAFIQGSSDLDEKLRALGIDTVVIVGAVTNVRCESTARDAMMLNYKVAFVSDPNTASLRKNPY